MPRVSKTKNVSRPEKGSIAAYIEEYCDWLLEKNFSALTVKGRRSYLEFFAGWCTDRAIFEPSEVSRAILERYQKWLFQYRKTGGDPLSFRSQHSQVVPVRAFFKWLSKRHYILYNPASELELPRLEQRLPKHILTNEEAETVLAVPNLAEPLGIRDRTMLEVLYSTGMRRGELTGLKIFDIDFDRGTLMIRQGKGKKDRVVPIGERALLWVRKYQDEVRPKFELSPDEGYLFLSDTGESIRPDRLTELTRDYINAAEIGKKGSCHLFRHTCATLMLEGGADIRFIQQLLGHAQLTTTQIYTQVSIAALKSIHTATHPGAMLNRKSNPSAE